MLVIFAYELIPSEYMAEEKINRTIAEFPVMPMCLVRGIEDLELKCVEIRHEIDLGRVFGCESTRSIYFAWDLPFTPSIGWKFCAPIPMGPGDSLATITNVYFGPGDTLLCEYE